MKSRPHPAYEREAGAISRADSKSGACSAVNAKVFFRTIAVPGIQTTEESRFDVHAIRFEERPDRAEPPRVF